MIKHYQCTQCRFRPMYQSEECPKCSSPMEECDYIEPSVTFKGGGFAANDLKS